MDTDKKKGSEEFHLVREMIYVTEENFNTAIKIAEEFKNGSTDRVPELVALFDSVRCPRRYDNMSFVEMIDLPPTTKAELIAACDEITRRK